MKNNNILTKSNNKPDSSKNVRSFLASLKDIMENKIARVRVIINKKKAPLINKILVKMRGDKFKLHTETLNIPKDRESRIYVVTHNSSYDLQNMIEILQTGGFGVVAVDDLPFLVKLSYWLIGMIPTDRNNPKKYNTSRQMELLLNNGADIIIHSEKTWNVEPDILMHYLNWGFVKVAKKTNKGVIPMIYHRTNNQDFHYRDLPERKIALDEDDEICAEKFQETMASRIGELIFFEGIQKSVSRNEFDPEKEKAERLKPEIMGYQLKYDNYERKHATKRKTYYSTFFHQRKKYIRIEEIANDLGVDIESFRNVKSFKPKK